MVNLEDPDLLNRLKFNVPQPGFYVEGMNYVYHPPFSELVYISGEKTPSRSTLTGLPMDGLVGRKFSHELLISPGEAQGFYKLSQHKIDGVLSSRGLPEGFVEWVQRMQSSG